jgi:hypothetical protein
MNIFDTRGKIAILTLVLGFLIAGTILGTYFFASDSLQHARFVFAQSTATTTVTVLNTPPNWTVFPVEVPPSTTSTPTNVGSQVTWQAMATDPNYDNYYLLLCKTTSTPTANNGAAPACGGGSGNQWTVSPSTVSGASSTAVYVPVSSDAQINTYYAWVCDGNLGGAKCNPTYEQGTFVVNHAPNFTSFSDNSPAIPGASVTWSAVASDTDTFTGSTDTVELFVCKAKDFTGAACGAGGTYCSSSLTLANPSCSSTIAIPTPDQSLPSYGYVLDQHQFAASGGAEATNATYTISAVAPTIASSSIYLLNTNGSSTGLILTNPGGQTTGFQDTFTVTDNNSCMNASGGQEVTSANLDVYRTGIGLANCSSSGNYNADNCYPAAVGTTTWNFSCTQNAGSCAGTSSLTSQWTCTFPLWYVADPTDGTASTTQYYNQAWGTAVQATNYTALSSPVTESVNTTTVVSFLASQLTTPTINFGALNPGSSTISTLSTTTLAELGNVGINETLYGTSMCSSFPSCPVSATSTIPVGQMTYASSVVPYASGITLLANPGALFPINIPKSISTSTPAAGSTFWGIAVPSTIQLSGAYTGQNTFVAVTSNPANW